MTARSLAFAVLFAPISNFPLTLCGKFDRHSLCGLVSFPNGGRTYCISLCKGHRIIELDKYGFVIILSFHDLSEVSGLIV